MRKSAHFIAYLILGILVSHTIKRNGRHDLYLLRNERRQLAICAGLRHQ